MGISDVDRSIWVLRGLVIVAIVSAGLYAITGTIQQQMWSLMCQVIPFAVALYGLWGFKYWGWIVAVIASGYDLTGLFLYIFDWSAHSNTIYDSIRQNPIKGLYSYVGHFVVNFFILLLLIIERDYFSE